VDSVSHVIVVRDLSVSPWPERRCVLTIGAYDGVHRGHQAVIAAVREQAKSLNALSVVVTFDKHPASVVRPESAPLLLTDLEQKIELLSTTGVDAVVVVPFNEEQSTEEPQSFVKRVLVDCLHVQHIVVGEDFHFGKNRSGNVALLRTEGAQHDFTTGPIELLARQDGVEEPISSTAIRRALRGGEIDTATALLGHAFEVRGPVVTGDQRGRTIGLLPPMFRFLASSAFLPTVCMQASTHVRQVSVTRVQSTLVVAPLFTSTAIHRCSKHTSLMNQLVSMAKMQRFSSHISCAQSESSMAPMRSLRK
jgi:riboflavin kinase/FMN adenylyltransferase